MGKVCQRTIWNFLIRFYVCLNLMRNIGQRNVPVVGAARAGRDAAAATIEALPQPPAVASNSTQDVLPGASSASASALEGQPKIQEGPPGVISPGSKNATDTLGAIPPPPPPVAVASNSSQDVLPGASSASSSALLGQPEIQEGPPGLISPGSRNATDALGTNQPPSALASNWSQDLLPGASSALSSALERGREKIKDLISGLLSTFKTANETCSIVFSIVTPGRRSLNASLMTGVADKDACESMCRTEKSCFAYQIKALSSNVSCFHQNTLAGLINLIDDQSVVEYVKSRNCTAPAAPGKGESPHHPDKSPHPASELRQASAKNENLAIPSTAVPLSETAEISKLKSKLHYTMIAVTILGVLVVASCGLGCYLLCTKGRTNSTQAEVDEREKLIDKKATKSSADRNKLATTEPAAKSTPLNKKPATEASTPATTTPQATNTTP